MAADLRVIPPEQLNRFELTGNSIPRARGEQVLAQDTPRGTFRVTRLAVLLPVPFGRVADTVQDLVKRTYGEASSAQAVGGAQFRPQNLAGAQRRAAEQEIEQLRTRGIQIERFKVRTVVSRPYNAISAASFSELNVQVVDGQDVFGTCSSLLLVYRVDHFTDWPRDNSFHTGIPVFPWRFPVEGRLITTTELRILKELQNTLRVNAAPQFSVPSDYRELPDSKVLESIKAALDGLEGSGGICR